MGGGGSENRIIMENADFVDTFLKGHRKTRLFFGFIFMHLQVFFTFNV